MASLSTSVVLNPSTSTSRFELTDEDWENNAERTLLKRQIANLEQRQAELAEKQSEVIKELMQKEVQEWDAGNK